MSSEKLQAAEKTYPSLEISGAGKSSNTKGIYDTIKTSKYAIVIHEGVVGDARAALDGKTIVAGVVDSGIVFDDAYLEITGRGGDLTAFNHGELKVLKYPVNKNSMEKERLHPSGNAESVNAWGHASVFIENNAGKVICENSEVKVGGYSREVTLFNHAKFKGRKVGKLKVDSTSQFEIEEIPEEIERI